MMPMLELCGRASDERFEYGGQILLIVKAALLGDLAKRELCCEQELFGDVDAVFLQIFARCAPTALTKELVKIIGAQIDCSGDVKQSDRLVIVRFYIFLCLNGDLALIGVGFGGAVGALKKQRKVAEELPIYKKFFAV